MGICAGTEEMYLGLRGFRTLDVRLERHWRSGVEIARWLEGGPRSRACCTRRCRAIRSTSSGSAISWAPAGLFSIVLKPCPKTALAAMLEGLELFGMGASWGGYESLVLPFDAAPAGRRPRGSPKVRRCACTSGSRTSTTSRPTWTPASRALQVQPERRNLGNHPVHSPSAAA